MLFSITNCTNCREYTNDEKVDLLVRAFFKKNVGTSEELSRSIHFCLEDTTYFIGSDNELWFRETLSWYQSELDSSSSFDNFNQPEFALNVDSSQYPSILNSCLKLNSELQITQLAGNFGNGDSICDVILWEPVFFNSGQYASICWMRGGNDYAVHVYWENYEFLDSIWVNRGCSQM